MRPRGEWGALVDDRGHGNIMQPDRVDDLVELMTPVVEDVLGRMEGQSFTTPQFIELLLSDPAGDAVYHEAVRRWGEAEHASKMVVHGQVIPAILRRSPRVEWSGYAHGEPDPYAVPAWWTLVERDAPLNP